MLCVGVAKKRMCLFYMRMFDPTHTVIGFPVPMVRVAPTKLPAQLPAIGVGSDCSRPTRLDEMQPLIWMPAPTVPVTLTSPDEHAPLAGGGVTTGPVSLPLSVPVPGRFVGRLSLWSLNPVTSLSLPTTCWPSLPCLHASPL